MAEFLLPDLGEGLTEAEITVWHVAVGDEVAIDQAVVEVETAKAAVEVPIPFAGRVSRLYAAPGESVAVGQPLISVLEAGAAAGLREPGAVVPEVADTTASTEASGNVLIGYGTPAGGRRRRRRVAAARVASVPTPEPALGDHRPPRTVAVVSPLVRKLARDAGLDLRTVDGSGPGGLIVRRDVLGATAQPSSTLPSDDGDLIRIPLRGVRKAVADKLSRSRREIPEATVWVDIDATELLRARAQINAVDPEAPVSVLALLARFVVAGLARYPELNGRVEPDEIVLSRAVHLGFAAQTERGLVVPVVHDAQRMSARELSGALSALTTAARDGAATPGDLTGGTFTLNNYGVFGVDGSAAIINHPEVAILGLGRIIDRPWVVDGALAVRRISQLTLSFDHRACDGGTAGGFLRFVADCVEAPLTVLGDL